MKQYYQDLNDLDIAPSLQRLQYLLDTVPALMQQVPESEFNQKPGPDKWSKKQIIGHLIDSAANNHQRFIRIQYEDKPILSYDQDAWNNLSYYQELDKERVINLWETMNRHLVHIAQNIPAQNLSRTGSLQSGEEMSLAFYINDYVKHAEYHLKDIVAY